MNYGIWVLTFGEDQKGEVGNPFHPDAIIPCEALARLKFLLLYFSRCQR